MPIKISEIAKKINAVVIGNKNIKISSIASFTANKTYSKKNNPVIVFISKYDIDENKTPKNTTFLLNKTVYEKFKQPDKFNFLISEDTKLSFALLTNLFKEKTTTPKYQILHPNSYKLLVGRNVSIGLNFKYGSNCLIEDNVTIGDNVSIENNVIIHHGTIIGNNVIIRSGSIIGSEGFGNVLTSDKSWCHIAHLGNVILKNDIDIGANCCIDRATLDSTVINSGVIIDNLVHIAHNVIIGENTAIAAKVGIAGSCSIGKRNMIGGMTGIIDHIKTADDVVISATSSVTTNINEPGHYTGIMPISKHAKWKRMAFWLTKLDKILKKFSINKDINNESNEYK